MAHEPITREDTIEAFELHRDGESDHLDPADPLNLILAAEAKLAAGIEDLLVPLGNACQACGAPSGEPCGPQCHAEADYLATLDDNVACDDCGAHTGQRCYRNCPRFADL
ncbi:MAG TPA: hypothetical protein VIQ30_22790 [Pseudonocardia sp.]